MRCKTCHSPLINNLKERLCPACGRGFDPGDPTTFEMIGVRNRPWIELSVIAVVSFLMGFAIVYVGNGSTTPTPMTPSTNGSWDWAYVRSTLLLAAVSWPVWFGFLYFAYRGISFFMRAWLRHDVDSMNMR